jgi:hypothetical protein
MRGLCNYPDGKTYEGEWLDGKPHGRGIKGWPDGRKYDGMWAQGKPVGQGRKIYPDGRAKEGYWEEGRFIEDGGKQFYLKFKDVFEQVSPLPMNQKSVGDTLGTKSLKSSLAGNTLKGAVRNND